MKLSNLVLGLAVATSGLVAVAGSSEAFTLSDIPTGQEYLFTFVPPSQGAYQSNFVIGTNKITEKAPGYDATSPDYPGSCVICSFVSTFGSPYLEAVDPTSTPSPSVYRFAAGSTASFFTMEWDDGGAGPDRDYNDFVVSARAVPVPAVVPGIALAAAFFGSKALKRNKKDASESVA